MENNKVFRDLLFRIYRSDMANAAPGNYVKGQIDYAYKLELISKEEREALDEVMLQRCGYEVILANAGLYIKDEEYLGYLVRWQDEYFFAIDMKHDYCGYVDDELNNHGININDADLFMLFEIEDIEEAECELWDYNGERLELKYYK